MDSIARGAAAVALGLGLAVVTGSGVGHADTADHTDHTDQSEQSGQSGGAGPSARKADAARSRPAKAGSQPAAGTVESAPAPTPGAGTDRGLEGEEPRLHLGERVAAARTGEAGREQVLARR